MKAYQEKFIQLALEKNALRFGEFILKSGRKSPYFFNAGEFSDGKSLAILGEIYADCIAENFSTHDYDTLFGPAYKGIALAVGAASGLYQRHQVNKAFAFNRKEAKDHGEGGMIVGSSLKNKRVLLIDDVITAGTAISQSADLLNAENARFMGAVIALDRQEKIDPKQTLTAVGQIAKRYAIKVVSILTLDILIKFVEEKTEFKEYELAIKNYREEYC